MTELGKYRYYREPADPAHGVMHPYYEIDIREGADWRSLEEGSPEFLDAVDCIEGRRAAVTFWLPKSQLRRENMALAFEEIARIFRESPPDTGLD